MNDEAGRTIDTLRDQVADALVSEEKRIESMLERFADVSGNESRGERTDGLPYLRQSQSTDYARAAGERDAYRRVLGWIDADTEDQPQGDTDE